MFIIHATRFDIPANYTTSVSRERKEICCIANDLEELNKIREFLLLTGYNVEYNG